MMEILKVGTDAVGSVSLSTVEMGSRTTARNVTMGIVTITTGVYRASPRCVVTGIPVPARDVMTVMGLTEMGATRIAPSPSVVTEDE
jgi:hypothetical protein